MDEDHLFNYVMWQEILLERDYADRIFMTRDFVRYCKYVAMQAGLNGLFTSKTPKEIISGYNDPMFQDFWNKPLYKGGDIATTGSNFSMVNGLTSPPDN